MVIVSSVSNIIAPNNNILIRLISRDERRVMIGGLVG